jgi:ubiquinone/menaquinone biosynthesis C-methylase UbiE
MNVDFGSEADASHYARYCDQHDTYQASSEHLVAVAAAASQSARRIVDLACGTGATALEICRRFGAPVELTCVDRSVHMLALAQAVPLLARAEFVCGTAETLDELVVPGVDLVICNSAFWMMNMPATLRAVATVLRPGGLFAFSIPGYLICDSAQRTPLGARPRLMEAFVEAVRRHELAAANEFDRVGYSISEDALQRIGARAGFELFGRQDCDLLESVSTTYDALCIPALLDSYAAALAPDRRMPLLNAVLREYESSPPTQVAWYAYLFRLTTAQDSA